MSRRKQGEADEAEETEEAGKADTAFAKASAVEESRGNLSYLFELQFTLDNLALDTLEQDIFRLKTNHFVSLLSLLSLLSLVSLLFPSS